MVATKIFYFYFNQRRIGDLLKILEDRFLALSRCDDEAIRKKQRFCYFQETILFLLTYFNALILSLSFPIQVIWFFFFKKNFTFVDHFADSTAVIRIERRVAASGKVSIRHQWQWFVEVFWSICVSVHHFHISLARHRIRRQHWRVHIEREPTAYKCCGP